MRLLVTRPSGDAEATAARLAALGHEALIAPMLERVLLPMSELGERPAAIALTSANALAGLDASPESRHWRNLPVFSVGGRTAAAARAAGYIDVRSAEGDSADLVRLIARDLSLSAGTILYPAATERAGHVDAALAAAGYRVHLAEVYSMQPAARLPEVVADALRQGTLDGVLLYSHRTAATLVRLADAAGLGAALAAVRAFAISEAVVAGLPFELVTLAAAPNEDALLAALEDGDGTSAAGIR